MKMLHLLSIATSLLFFVGCASNPMQVSKNQAVDAPSTDKAQLVFMRSSFVGSAINSSIYDVSSGEVKYLGIMANATKVVYEVEPGVHKFMVVSEAADFLEANLEGGKTYYSMVTPRMGAWKARFSMWPVRTDGSGEFNTTDKNFAKWLKTTKRVDMTPKAEQWYQKNKASVAKKYQAYQAVWSKKTADALAEHTLNPDDGI